MGGTAAGGVVTGSDLPLTRRYSPPVPPAPPPTHAGAVVYRRAAGRTEFLLVSARKRDGWVFPKGHVEAGEPPRAAALREVREEAGVEGALGPALGTQEFVAGGEPVRVRWWLLEAGAEDPSPEGRSKRWVTLDEALGLVPFEEQRDLLRRAALLVEEGLDPRGE